MTEPVVAKKGPYVVDMEPGTYFWCACGKSKKQPFCDGSHKGSSFSPTKIVIDTAKTVFFCGCKHTDSKPFCDGSHSSV